MDRIELPHPDSLDAFRSEIAAAIYKAAQVGDTSTCDSLREKIGDIERVQDMLAGRDTELIGLLNYAGTISPE